MKTWSLIALLGLSGFVASCGEVYEATYRGTAVVSKSLGGSSVCSAVPPGNYTMALRTTIADNITIRITEIKRNGDTSAAPIMSTLNEVKATAKFAGGKNDFSIGDTRIYANSDKDTYQLSGQISTDQKTLNISQLTVGFDLGLSSQCVISLSGQFQKD